MCRRSISLFVSGIAMVLAFPGLLRAQTFTAHTDYAVGSQPESVTVADFNRDGKLDLAVANRVSGTVSVLLGNGNGTFAAATTFNGGRGPSCIASGDFNGDGKPDLSVCNYDSSVFVATTVSILLGNGDGTFQPAQTFEAGSGPNAMVVGDFDLNGALDLAVADFGYDFPNPASTSVAVLLGNGNGTFRSPLLFTVGNRPTSVTAGDFNGDGWLDLATGNFGDATISVLLGNGNGFFQSLGTADVGSAPWDLAVGDFNGDAIADLAVVNFYSNTLSMLLGNGNGTFQAALTFPTGSGPDAVAVGDLNADGLQDLVVANWSATTLSVFNGNGDGTFKPARNYGVGGAPSAIVVRGLNGDAKPDLVAANYSSGTVSILINTSGGTPPLNTLTVSKGGTGTGTVTSTSNPANGTQINCGSNCSASYSAGTVVTLTAQADPSSTVTGWSGCDSASGTTCTVTMNASRSVSATFDRAQFVLSVSKSGTGGGSVASTSNPSSPTQINCGATCSASYDQGTVVTLTAQADSSSTFIGWIGCDSASGTTCTVTMNTARSVSATFNKPRFVLSVSKSGTGAGTVTSTSNPSSPTQISCGATCSASYDTGTVVTLSAAPASGSIFMSWSGCDSASGSSCTVTMSSQRSVVASFVRVLPF